jgi:hypothetical protein
MFRPEDVDVLSAVRMLSPANVHARRVRIVELVIVLRRPLDVDSGLVGVTESVVVTEPWAFSVCSLIVLLHFYCRYPASDTRRVRRH